MMSAQQQQQQHVLLQYDARVKQHSRMKRVHN
jgi:hypothetical protein